MGTHLHKSQEFRPLLESAFAKERKSPAGRKRIDVIVMLRILVLQQLHNLSDEEVEFQVNDRRSFEKFAGLGVMHSIPDATTVALFRAQLRQAGIFEELFQKFDAYLEEQGLTARGRQIIDATIVPVPKQQNRRKDNEEIKQGKVPEDWQDNPNRLQQKDLDARWTKKNGISHYGDKHSISIDAIYGLIRRHVLTPANLHDSQKCFQLCWMARTPMPWSGQIRLIRASGSTVSSRRQATRVGFKKKGVATIPWTLLPKKEIGNAPGPAPRWNTSLDRWRWSWEASGPVVLV